MKTFLIFNLIIITIFLIRKLADGKIPRRMQYGLWLILPIFVILSFSISIPVKVSKPDEHFSVSAGSADSLSDHPALIDPHNSMRTEYSRVQTIPTLSNAHEQSAPETDKMTAGKIADPSVDDYKSAASGRYFTSGLDYMKIAGIIYVAGAMAVGGTIVFNNVFFAIKTYRRRRFYGRSEFGGLKIYKLTGIKSPFLLGKNIYVSDDMDEKDEIYRYSVCHEYCHYAQGDMFWPLLKYAFVTFLWFDPLIWPAAVMMERDSELAVDERVLTILGKDNKAGYSETLLKLATRTGSNQTIALTATSMSGKSRSFLKKRISCIMSGTRKSISVLLTVSIALAAIVSCSLINRKNIREPSYVAADSMWYDSAEVIYGQEQQELLGEDDIVMRPLLITPDARIFRLAVSEDPDLYPAGPATPQKIISYSEDGDLIGSIDLIENNDILCLTVADGVVKGIVGNYQSGQYNLYTLDFEQGLMTDERDVFKGSSYPCDSYTQIAYRDGLFYIESSYIENSLYKSVFSITDIDGNIIDQFTLDYDSVRWTVNSNGDLLCMGLSTTGYDMLFDYFLVDHDNGNVTALDISDEMAERYNGNSVISGDYLYMVNSNYVITRYDPLNQEETVVFDFNSSYTDIHKLSFFDLYYCDEDELVMVRNGYYIGPDQGEGTSGRDIITLRRASSNPNAGKTILRAAIVGDLRPVESFAISEFNRTDPDYFIVIDPEFYVHTIYWDSAYNFESYAQAEAYILDELRITVEDGTGPDIVLNAGGFYVMENDDLFIDMNEMIDSDDSLERADFIDACFRAAETDGELYHIPLSATVNGWLLDPECIPADTIGFTFSEYRDFGEEYGYYPYYYQNKGELLDQLFSCEDFIEDGTINIDTESFRDLVALTDAIAAGEHNSAHYLPVSMNDFWYLMIDSDYTSKTDWLITGGPSVDGHGPTLFPSMTAAITDCTSSEDGAWRFISFALGEEVQSHSSDIPINIAAFYDLGERWLEYANRSYHDEHFSRDYLDMILGWLERTDSCRITDENINMIINEEMPGFFDGQKSLDEVIDIISNRVNLLMEEK